MQSNIIFWMELDSSSKHLRFLSPNYPTDRGWDCIIPYNFSFVCHEKVESTSVQMRACLLFLVKFWRSYYRWYYDWWLGVTRRDSYLCVNSLLFVCHLYTRNFFTTLTIISFKEENLKYIDCIPELSCLFQIHGNLHLSHSPSNVPKNQQWPFLTLLLALLVNLDTSQ